MEDKNKELCPRLIDYLVVVGRRKRTRSDSFSQQSFDGEPVAQLVTQNSAGFVSKPELLRRYPTDDHKDFILPTDVTVFCQPEGCISLGPQRRVHTVRDKVSFVFTLTEKDSAKIRYGVCINFFQQCERRSNVEKNGSVNEQQHAQLKRRQPICSLTSLCLISHHPFLTIYRQLLELLHQLIDAANFRCNLDDSIAKDAVWLVLIGRWTDPIPEKVMNEIRQLETWILMLMSSPVPVPGKTKVQLDVMPEDIELSKFEFALPDHTRFSLVDFPLHLPLELLGVDTAVQVLAAVMLEYKVVLQSRNYNAVSMCVLAIVALLYPLEYMFPVIPLLPAYMNSAEQLLLAPTPFIIGVPASFFLHRKIKKLPNDVILVDLDTNEVTIPEGLEIPPLPEPDTSILKQNFRNALGKMTSVADREENGRQGSFEASYVSDSDEIDVAARVAMIQFFNSPNIFANFSEHTRTLRLYPRPVVALQTESFLRSRPQITDFIRDLCKTQAVEYFAECSLCPRNETYVRVQTGIVSAPQIGDKSKWFADTLMPLHYTTYPNESTLADAYRFYHSNQHYRSSDSDDDELNDSEMGSSSSIDEIVFDSSQSECEQSQETSKPLGEVNYIYKEPLRLELPLSDSAQSIHSSASSGRSSPGSSVSASAFDSEADIARMAANLVLKSDSKGDFSFDHSGEPLIQTDHNDNTPIQNRKGIVLTTKTMLSQPNSNSSTPTNKTPPFKAVGMKGLHTLTDSGEKMLGPNFMNAINGYAEKSHDMFNQMLTKTAPRAQALRDKTMRPLAAAAANRIDVAQKRPQTSAQTASQQSKNQQMMREICDQVVAGNGVGMFVYSRMKRLMEDESLRELVCSKLNLGLEVKRREDENVPDIPLTPTQYKGYLKVLQSCIQGLETSFNTPGSNGLASVFHVLEIAYTHFLASGHGAITPVSGMNSQAGTPSSSVNDFQSTNSVKLPATSFDTRQGTSAAAPQRIGRRPSEPPSVPPPPLPPLIPPRHAGIQLPRSVPPPPLPPRPPPPRQESIIENSKLTTQRTIEITEDMSFNGHANGDLPSNSQPAAVASKFDSEVKQSEQPLTNGHDTKNAPAEPSTSKDQKTLEPVPLKPMQLPRSLPVDKNSLMTSPQENSRHYIYHDLILPHQNQLWQKMVFWENAFFDVVAQERDIVGMDQEPSEMIDRYSGLADCEKKRLELEEDRLLSTLLHNLTAYMVMCGTTQKSIQQKIRRLLGKAHIGLVYSKTINQLLDSLPPQQGNAIPLKPLGSRLIQKYSFTVHAGSSLNCPMMFMEVCDDAVVLRAVSGAISERWWYERLVNMTYSPKTRVLCLWLRRSDVEQVQLHKFYTKRFFVLISLASSAESCTTA
ncbi:hypothetical protein L596_004034 [Steinernema carpocapsae]|uniref:MAP kinase-activating death domain protein n=1 Tax=Steinernema carpocapsae TaxID=34508 RepID=A0A4U8UUG8_STECR|nr:hypothetical protein L596_004034 [Steinernema carpocapsae]